MASGFPGRGYYGALGGGGHPIYQQRVDTGSGLLKRSMAEMEMQQRAMLLRSVKQKTLQASPISPLSPVDLFAISPEISSSSTSSSLSSSSSFLPPNLAFVQRQNNARSSDPSFTAMAKPDVEKNSVMQNRLQELERQLLDDEDVDETSVSMAGSAVTNSEWGKTMQQLVSVNTLAQTTPSQVHIQNPVSPSPTTSSSSSSSSTASCSSSSSTPSLRQLIVDTATAIAEGNLEMAAANLAALKRAANSRGDPEQRLTAYMVGGLLSRMNPPQPGAHPASELCSPQHLAATKLLHEASPVFKLALMAANYAILEATRDQPKIHIIDFDVRHGGQYASLIHALAKQHRDRRPPALKITAVCDPTLSINALDNVSDLRIVGERLARLAECEGVAVSFNIVQRRVAELDRVTLGCEPEEALVVNLAFLLSRVADESVSPANPRDELLRRVRALGPAVVTLVEHDLNTNTAPFAARAAEACAHYGALLESLDVTASRDSRDRAAVEQCLGRRAINAVAREGPERIERCEVFGKWRARMGMAGFKPSPLGPSVTEPLRAGLNSLRANHGLTLKEEAGGLGLGWTGRVLTVASAWR